MLFYTAVVVFCINVSVTIAFHPCNYKTEIQNDIPPFRKNRTDIPSYVVALHVLDIENDTSPCYIHADQISPTNTSMQTSLVSIAFGIVCTTNKQLSFVIPTNQSIWNNILTLIQIHNCVVDRENFDEFLTISNTRTLFLLGSKFSSIGDKTVCESHGFQNLQSFGLSGMLESEQDILSHLFNCSDFDIDMKEISLHACKETININLLRSLFPKLQGIEITFCDIQGHFQFPITSTPYELPYGISRSIFLQDHYSDSMHINIPSNIFRRFLSLCNNGKFDVNQLMFSGSFRYLKISNNIIPEIMETMFANTSGIQSIVLTENEINWIENGAFNKQYELTFLDISKNNLSLLHPNIFNQLESLRILNLGYNRLTDLPKWIFYNLDNLQELNLENNKILIIDKFVLPKNNIKLELINLNNNPLREFPVSVLYIRKLRKVELRQTDISLGNLTALLNNIDVNTLLNSVVESRSSLNIHLYKTIENWRIIDLTESHVTGFIIPENATVLVQKLLIIILKHFKFILNKNPLACFSDINPFNRLMKNYTDNKNWTGQEYFFKEWLCQYPEDFRGKEILKIESENTYNTAIYVDCPRHCNCYSRYRQNITIVDCRNRQLLFLPEFKPYNIIDLWLQNNNISVIEFKEYFRYVRHLSMSDNRIEHIDSAIFQKMKNLKKIELDNNLLSYIPKSITSLNLDVIDINGNPLVCDCHSLWLKHWMLINIGSVVNIQRVTCQTQKGKGNTLVSVLDEDFTCFDEYLLPVVVSVSLFLVMVLLFISILCRFKLKVLIYMYFGFHPWDRLEPDEEEFIDIFIIHTNDMSEIVEENIYDPLSRRELVVCTSDRNFIAGYSFQQNISSAAYHSKHILLVLSDDLLKSGNFLNCILADSRSKMKTRTNFLFITWDLTFDLSKAKNQFPFDFRKYLSCQKCLQSFMFRDEIIYILTSYRRRTDASACSEMMEIGRDLIHPSDLQSDTEDEVKLFIYCSENDKIVCYEKCISHLKKHNFNVLTADSIRPGTSILQGIWNAITVSSHTILILNRSSTLEEEQKIVFQHGMETTRGNEYNHLIVVFRDDNYDVIDDNQQIKDYAKYYVTLDIEHPTFFNNLLKSLRTGTNTRENKIMAEEIEVTCT